MFTGIVQHVGAVCRVREVGGGRRLGVDLGPLAEGLSAGASVAVAGVCLTVASLEGSVADFDVVPATLAMTTLGLLRVGSKVNLERSLRLDAGLEGHIVQGHVDGVASVRSVRRSGGDWIVEFTCPRQLTDGMVPQGSVAVDGVSLTLKDLAPGRFFVALIPVTLEATTLGALAAGDKVNVETDVIGKYVAKYAGRFAPREGGVTLEKLREQGYA